MRGFTFDDDNNLVLDFDDVLDRMPSEAKVRLALLLANQTPVMLHVAQLLADGITFDGLNRFYYPPEDDMQEARLYLLEHFEEVQRTTTERAIADRKKTEDAARHWESTARYLAGGTSWDNHFAERAYYDRLRDAEAKADAWISEHGGRCIR